MNNKSCIQTVSLLRELALNIHGVIDVIDDRNCKDIIAMLENQEPVDIEIEGGGNSWWYVCEECRGAVDTSDSFCRHCGRPFRKRKCAGCKDDCPQTGNFVCPNGKL